MMTAVDGRIDCAMTEQLQYYSTLLWDEPDASERVSRDYLAYLGGLHINTAFLAAGQALARSQGRQLVLTYRRRGSRRGLPQRVVRARQRRGYSKL